MTVWVLHQELDAGEEERIHERTHLRLPFEGLPDLSRIPDRKTFMELLRALHPQEPPETLALHFDRIWGQYTTLQDEDVVAVPLPHSGNVALAKVKGRYSYEVDEHNQDIHLIGVEWYPNMETIKSFWRDKELFNRTGNGLTAVTQAAARKAILARLPIRYNRLSTMKVIWIFIFLLMLARLYSRMH